MNHGMSLAKTFRLRAEVAAAPSSAENEGREEAGIRTAENVDTANNFLGAHLSMSSMGGHRQVKNARIFFYTKERRHILGLLENIAIRDQSKFLSLRVVKIFKACHKSGSRSW